LSNTIPEFKTGPVVVLILSIITCGLYLIYWNIEASRVLNAVAGREAVSMPIAIFAGCCTPVHLYFYYVVSRDALPALYDRIGQPQKDQAILLMLLGFFFPMVAAMIVQGEINKLYEKPH